MHTIIDKKDDDYEFDFTGNIDNSNLLEETRALLAVIYKKYWTTPEERRRIEAKIKNDLK